MDALAMLRLQMEWGADEALEDAPVDRLRPPQAARPSAPAVELRKPTTVSSATATVGTPVERAMRAAAQAETLDELRTTIATFAGDPLRDMATKMVFATGDADAGTMLISGPPGADEDRAGTPFAGREGALLDQILASVALRRDTMLLAPLIPWRPPGGRTPNPGELQLYRPFLMRLIGLTAPSRIVLFGALAASTVLGAGKRGRSVAWIDAPIDSRTVQTLVLPTLADVLKTPSRGKDIWAGARLLRRALDR
jgi:uracil-DNA glycosylase